MTDKFAVGSRVVYVGKPVQNKEQPDSKEDLVFGILGTVVKNRLAGFPLEVKFDNHKEELIWPVSYEEVQNYDEYIKNSAENLSTEHKLQIAETKLSLLKEVILALDEQDAIDAYLDEIDMEFKFSIKDQAGNVIKRFDETVTLKSFLDGIDYLKRL